MGNLNTAAIQGRFTADPELRKTNTGKSVTSFTIASDGMSEGQTNWIDCVAWGKSAEFICKYFRKGSMVAVHGSIQTKNYEDKNGAKRKATELVVNQAYFCGAKADSDSEPANEPVPNVPQTETSATAEADDDDLPF